MFRKLYIGLLLAGLVICFLPQGVRAYDLLLDNWSSDGATSRVWGKVANTWSQRVAYEFLPPSGTDLYICSVSWRMQAVGGSATDTISVALYAEGSNPENGTLLTTWTNDALPDVGTWSWINFAGNCQYVEGGKTYWFTMTRGSLSDTNYYYVQHGLAGYRWWGYILGSWGSGSTTAKPFAVQATGIGGLVPPVATTTNPLANKFPFSWIYDLQDIFEGQSTSSTTTFPSVSLDMSSSSLPMTIAIFSTTTIGKFMGGNFTIFYNMMKWALWLAFSYYVYRRLTRLSIKGTE